ncbi:MAG: DUF2088 domain-containing protein [Acidimicrobiia bacterium]|nr:DUF2088 domain-containing protein [Acidimicrobiia bacterium]
MHRVIQHFPRPTLPDLGAAIRAELDRPEVAARLEPLHTVALAVGSRGIAHLAEMVTALVAALRSRGLDVFIVPAMGSHGGATAAGQEAVLAHLGVTTERAGAPIRSSMETVEIATVASPHGHDIPVMWDAIAWREADAVIPVNRIKPHTGFRGPVESGLCKMLAIGLGKHAGARVLHGEGYVVFDRLIHDAGRAIVATGRVAFGLGIIENAYGDVSLIEAVPADRIPEREPELLDQARRLMPRLLMPAVDVLVVEEFGKDISGVGMDANITGRGETGGALPRFDGPVITRIVVLGLTEAAGGNAHGIGLADLITQRAFDQIDRNATWINSLTAGSLAAGKTPIALPTDDEAIAAATRSLPGIAPEAARVVRIKNTLHLTDIAVSDTLLETCRATPGCEVVGSWDGTWRV